MASSWEFTALLEQLCVCTPEWGWGGLKATPMEWDPPLNSSAVTTELSSPEVWLLSSISVIVRGGGSGRDNGVLQGGLEMDLAWNM